MQNHKKLFVLAGVGAALVFGLATAALAETYEVDHPLYGTPQVAVGTNGSDAYGAVAVSQGGCASGLYAGIAIGESNHQCPLGSNEGSGTIGLGLAGADASSSLLAVAPDGDAASDCWNFVISCLAPGTSVSGTGNASAIGGYGGWGTAVSGTGNASTDADWSTAVSGTGTAAGNCDQYHHRTVAISGTNDASSCIAVSGTGHASGTTTVSGGDLLP